MSNFNFADNLFLETEELNRFNDFLTTEGYMFNLLADTENYGIIKNSVIDTGFNYFKVAQGSGGFFLTMQEGYAFDSNGNRIHYQQPATQIPLPNVGIWYWLKIAHQYTTIEEGTISIGGINSGAMSGTGTFFTQVLRGQPNFPAKIKFPNSVNYGTLEYEILQVIDDNNAIVQGSFEVVENNIQYAIIGTFDPAYYPTATEKGPFQYDDCLVTLVPEVTLGVKPAINNGVEFLIARVQNTGTSIIIQDYRRDYIHRTRLEKKLNTIPTTNPLIGITQIQQIQVGGGYFYDISLDWKFTINNETQYLDTSMVTVALGSGGIYATTASFNNGDFDGWKYYYVDGDYSTVVSSTKNGNTIVLQLDAIKEGVAGQYICPAIDEIEIQYSLQRTNGTTYHTDSKVFDSITANPIITIAQNFILNANQVVYIQWKYKNYFLKTAYAPLNQGTYYNDQAFDPVTGNLTTPSSTTTSTNAVLGAAATNSAVTIPTFCPIPWDVPAGVNVSDYFDQTGLGNAGQFIGWAICNGNNNTNDWSGVMPVGATRVNTNLALPRTGAPPLSSDAQANPVNVGQVVGSSTSVITSPDQLPTFNPQNYMTDPGHTHTSTVQEDTKGGSAGVNVLSSSPTAIGHGEYNLIIDNAQTGITFTAIGKSSPINTRPVSRGVVWICRII